MCREDKTKKKFPGFPKPTYPMVPDGLFEGLLTDLKGGRR